MQYRALIPVKNLAEAKTRLAPHLSQRERATLMLDMLHHVVHTLHASGAFERITVVSPDSYVLDQARLWLAHPRLEEAEGHNPALSSAALHDLAEGCTGLLTISADLPLLRACDIDDLLARAEQNDLVLAPSHEGTGTNAVFARPPLAVPYVFGPASLSHYRAEAQQRGLAYTLYTSIGLSQDIDTLSDLEICRELDEMSQCAHMVYY